VAEWEEIAEERIVMTEEPHTVTDLEEVRKLYIEMIKIRSGEELEKLRTFFEDQLERMQKRVAIARELKLPEEIITTKNMLAMMYKNLIELCIKKARGEEIE
jgi:diaminopimelate decarboxylase